eukprot:6044322-Amphidinium_carterae.1
MVEGALVDCCGAKLSAHFLNKLQLQDCNISVLGTQQPKRNISCAKEYLWQYCVIVFVENLITPATIVDIHLAAGNFTCKYPSPKNKVAIVVSQKLNNTYPALCLTKKLKYSTGQNDYRPT